MRAGLAGFGAVAVGAASQPRAGGVTSLAAALAWRGFQAVASIRDG